MRLYDEIFNNPDGGAVSRCVIVPNGGGYFEGVKWVGDFSSEKILVCFPRVRIEVEGVGLAIKKYCDGDLRLSGKIRALRVINEGEN
jgi:hypothetical protein